MATDSTVVLDYTSRDFEAIRSMLVGIARGKFPEWVTVGEAGDFGTLLLELYAYMGDVTNYYIDRVGSEAFLGTAALRRSVLYIADMLGYRPIGQQAASVVLRASLAATADTRVTLFAGTTVRTNDSSEVQASFELDTNLVLDPGDVDVIVSATEGTTVTETLGTSRGIPNAEFQLANKGVIFRSLEITSVEGSQRVVWDYVDHLVNARPTQSAFSTYVDDKGVTHVLFGDNSAGRIPQTGVILEARYRYGIGAAANSIAAGTIDTLVGQAQPTGMAFLNIDTPLGGADLETVESMRFSIPRTQSVADRAVTLDDYVSLTLKVPSVGKAMAVGQVYSNVTVRIAPVGGAPAVDEGQMDVVRDSVSSYLSDKVMIGSTVYVEDVYQHDDQGWEDIVIDLDLYVQSGYNRSEIENRVREAIIDVLAFERVDFGTRIPIGLIYRTIMSVEGVDYAELKTMTSENTTDSSPVANIVTPANRIPRIRAEIEADGFITQEFGLTITSLGGLV